MGKAKKILERYQAIFDNPQNTLRFDRGIVSISDIGQQFYCEKEVHLKYEYPLEPTNEMTTGKEAHESVTTLAEKVTKEDAIENALGKKPVCIYEFGVGWNYKNVPIIGRVDEVWFNSGNVELVVERKFSNSLTDYLTHHVQARLYCLALEEMGFDTSSTNYQIQVFKRSCFECPDLTLKVCKIFEPHRKSYRCDDGETKIFIRNFNKDTATDDLDWALDYWLKRREAIPSKNPAKCRACQQKINCESALV